MKRQSGITARIQAIVLVSAFAVTMVACGSTNPPTQQLTETQMLIQQADQEGAANYAPLEIREAKRKLEQARSAVDQEDFDRALRLLEQANVDAELAHKKSLSSKSQETVFELRENIRTLQEEIERISRQIN